MKRTIPPLVVGCGGIRIQVYTLLTTFFALPSTGWCPALIRLEVRYNMAQEVLPKTSWLDTAAHTNFPESKITNPEH